MSATRTTSHYRVVHFQGGGQDKRKIDDNVGRAIERTTPDQIEKFYGRNTIARIEIVRVTTIIETLAEAIMPGVKL